MVVESMKLPVDNLLGMLLYAVLYMLCTGILVFIAFRFIPNRIPFPIKNAILGGSVFISIYVWWLTIVQ